MLLVLPFAAAFMPNVPERLSTQLTATKTKGKAAKPASSGAEDLRLTLKIIMDHEKRSTTFGKDQFIKQMQALNTAVTPPPIDVSIPYDAAARLEYEATKQTGDFEKFRQQYEKKAIKLVKSKQPSFIKSKRRKTVASLLLSAGLVAVGVWKWELLVAGFAAGVSKGRLFLQG